MNNYLPVMLLKDLITLPNQEVKVELSNSLSKKLLTLAFKHHNGDLLIVCPKDALEESPDINDLPLVGVVGHIKSKIVLPNGNIRVTLVGINRVNIFEYRNFDDDKEILMANVKVIEIPKSDLVEQTALRRKLVKITNRYLNESSNVSNSINNSLKEVVDLYKLTDIIASFIPLQLEKKIYYMEEVDPVKRANQLIYDIAVELEIIALDKKMDATITKELENNQKEYILKEKLSYIQKELGIDKDDNVDIKQEYLQKLESLKLSNKTKNKLLDEIHKLSNIQDNHPEMSVIRNYLDTVLNLPWNNASSDCLDLAKIKHNLDKTHYGLSNAKARILEYVAVKKRNPDIKSPIICLVGPPGVGKTSFGMNVAKSLHKEFYKISVGGLNDTNELMGNRRTYIGSSPGKIMQALLKCGVNNPVILIDEIDKMVKNYQGDPASSMLEILDPEQNMMFTDNYIEEPFDISKVLFILTANDETAIPKVLKDRLEIIELSSYTEFEKADIARKYLIPNILKEYNLTGKNIKFNDETILEIVNRYTKEAGLRELKRNLNTIIRKVIIEYDDKEIHRVLGLKDILKYLGKPKYQTIINSTLRPGLCNALAYTPMGGVVIPIESCLYDGEGKIISSGSLGKVTAESVQVALSYIKSNKDIFQVSNCHFEHKDIHIHFLEGAVPKDGPSSGASIVTSILSLILNKNIPEDIAMTGEITLRGDILTIGGLKEKILGAYNSNIKQVFIPSGNINDLDEIPKKVRQNLDIIPVSNYIEIFQRIFN